MYNQDNNDSMQRRQDPAVRKQQAANTFAGAAVICAVFSIISVLSLIGPIFFGALAAIFAGLSKGKKKRPSKTARISRTIGIIMMLISVAITGSTCAYLFTHYDSIEDFLTDYEDLLEQYGIDLEDYGIDTDESADDSAGSDSYTVPDSNDYELTLPSGNQKAL